MNEEEIIKKIKTFLEIEKDGFSGHLEAKTIQGLFDLYNKQKEEIKELKLMIAVANKLEKEIKKKFISKDKIKKELLEPINKERQETYKEFMKKGKDDYHGIEGSVLQELNWVVVTIEELLEED